MHKAQESVRARLPAQELERNKETAHEDLTVCGNESAADVSNSKFDVSVDGDTEVSVSSALEISEDEDEDAG